MSHNKKSRLSVGIVWPEPVSQNLYEEVLLLLPDPVQLHMQTVDPPPQLLGGITLENVVGIATNPNIEETAQKLAGLGVRAVGYGCTSGSYARGIGGDTDIAYRMQEASGVPATTTSTAAVRALRQLGVHRVAVLSPHVDELNQRLKEFLGDSGFDVVHIVGLNKLSGIEEISPTIVATLVKEQVDSPEADGIFISCTGLRTAAIIDTLEQRLSKPVVGANQATTWDLLRLAHSLTPKAGLGRLYKEPVSEM